MRISRTAAAARLRLCTLGTCCLLQHRGVHGDGAADILLDPARSDTSVPAAWDATSVADQAILYCWQASNSRITTVPANTSWSWVSPVPTT